MGNKVNEVILAFIGEPASPNSCFTTSGYGYNALVCSEHMEIRTLFDSLALWCGPTKKYNKNGDIYFNYELACRDRDFFESSIFKRICKPYNIKITVCKTYAELYELFYKHAESL